LQTRDAFSVIALFLALTLKRTKHHLLAPIAVEILFIFSLKIKRLQRKVGRVFLKTRHFLLLKLAKNA
ncbi:MAG: hypothetical protein KKH44_10980, partial [Bacteroidetes bacterium]|nr:hypothetical protein [Bacteroidota bacterium]